MEEHGAGGSELPAHLLFQPHQGLPVFISFKFLPKTELAQRLVPTSFQQRYIRLHKGVHLHLLMALRSVTVARSTLAYLVTLAQLSVGITNITMAVDGVHGHNSVQPILQRFGLGWAPMALRTGATSFMRRCRTVYAVLPTLLF